VGVTNMPKMPLGIALLLAAVLIATGVVPGGAQAAPIRAA